MECCMERSVQEKMLETAMTGYIEEPPKAISDWAAHYLAPPVPEEEREIKDVPTMVELQIRLDISDEAALQRALGRMRDPMTGSVYHVEFDPAV